MIRRYRSDTATSRSDDKRFGYSALSFVADNHGSRPLGRTKLRSHDNLTCWAPADAQLIVAFPKRFLKWRRASGWARCFVGFRQTRQDDEQSQHERDDAYKGRD